MSNIKQFFDKDGNDIYPVTHASAVFDSDGNDLVNIIKKHEQKQNSASIKEFGAKCDGITDDTEALKQALLSDYPIIRIPSGVTYISNGDIVVTNTISKKIIGEANSTIKCNFNSAKRLITTYVNLCIDNIKFDFSNNNCTNALLTGSTVTSTTITNCTFENVRDLNNTSTCIINVVYGKLFIDNIVIQDCYKLENGVIGDAGGNLTGILYGSNDEYHANIENVTIKNMHSINNEGNIAYDDVSCIYIVSNSEIGQCMIQNVKGYNFGRRFIKTQANNVHIDGLCTKCETPATIAVVGFNDFDTPLSRRNVSINNFRIEGCCLYAIATSVYDTKICNGVIDIDDTSRTVGATDATVALLKTHDILVRNVTAKSNNVLFIAGGETYKTRDVRIENCVFEYNKPYGVRCMEESVGSQTILSNITIKDCIFKLSGKALNSLIIDGSTLKESSNNIRIVNNSFTVTESDATTESILNVMSFNNTKNVFIDNNIIQSGSMCSIFEGIKLMNNKYATISNLYIYQEDFDSQYARRVVNIQNSSGIILDNIIAENADMLAFSNCANVVVSSIDYNMITNVNRSSTIFTNTKLGLSMSTRPSSNLYIGYCHYDTNLKKPIWWNGKEWVDATGTVVS